MSYDSPYPQGRPHEGTPGYAGQAWPADSYQGGYAGQPGYGGQPEYDQAGYSQEGYGQQDYQDGFDGSPAYEAPGYGGFPQMSVYPQSGEHPAHTDAYGGAQDDFAAAPWERDGYAQPQAWDFPAQATPARTSGSMPQVPDQQSWGGLDGQDPVPERRGVLTGAIMGLISAGAAVGIATFFAAFFRPNASPIIAVGEAFIDRTPQWLKEFAIQKFGEHDKDMLLLGMYVTIAFLAMAIGVMARRHTSIGVIGVAVFGAFGAFVAYTRPASKVSDIIPSLIGGVAGVIALLLLANASAPVPERAYRTHGGRR